MSSPGKGINSGICRSRAFKPCIQLLALLVWCSTAPAAEPESYSVKQLVEQAQRDNKDLQAARAAIAIGQARLVQAGLLPNPRLDLSARSDFAFRNEGEYATSVGVSQQFPIAGRILRQKDVARVDIALAQAEVQEAERKLAGAVATAAYGALVIDLQVASREELIGVEQHLAKATRDRFKAAEVSELDVNTVQLDLQRLAQERDLLLSQRQALVVSLNTLLGRPATNALVIRESLPGDEPLPPLDRLQAIAIRGRPDLRSAILGADRAHAEILLAKAQRWEDWSIGVGFDQDKLAIDGAPEQSPSRALGLNLSIPLPLFNKNQGLIAEAEATADQAKSRIEAMRLTVAGDVASARAQAATLQLQLNQYRESLLPVSRRNVTLAQKGYGEGLVSLLEVVQAQRQQADLSAAYLAALDQYLQALVRLQTATGGYVSTVATTMEHETKDK